MWSLLRHDGHKDIIGHSVSDLDHGASLVAKTLSTTVERVIREALMIAGQGLVRSSGIACLDQGSARGGRNCDQGFHMNS
jgi:hypothetical protein